LRSNRHNTYSIITIDKLTLLSLNSDYGVTKKSLKMTQKNCFFGKVVSSRHIICMSSPYSLIKFQKCKISNIYQFHIKLRAKADIVTRDTFMSSSSELSKKIFCGGHEIKLSSPFCGIQQAGASETAMKSVTSCFYLRLVITSG